MSMSIFFMPCRFSEQPVLKTNPFTGKEQVVYPTHPLPESQVLSIRQLLSKYATNDQEESAEVCTIVFGESAYRGSLVEVDVSDLVNGCAITIRGESPELYPFLFDFLKSTDWMMIATQSDIFAIVGSLDRLRNVPPDFMKIVRCESPDQLENLLGNGIQAAEEYRKQVTGE